MKEYSVYNATLLYIKQCPAEEIGTLTVNDIARKFNVNRSFLSRSFRRYDSISAKRYLDIYVTIRFEILASRLKNPNVKEALAIMKIHNVSHFIKRFKNRRGYTPGQYCKQCREQRKERERKWGWSSGRKKGRK